MSTKHEFIVTLAEIEGHRKERAFPWHSSDGEHDDMIIEIQRNFGHPGFVSLFCFLHHLTSLHVRVSLAIFIAAFVRSHQKEAVYSLEFLVDALQRLGGLER